MKYQSGTFGRGDIADEALAAGNGFDRVQVDTDFDTAHRHVFFGHLKPATGRSAQVDQDIGVVEELIFAIQLNELEGSSGTETSFF